jgi:putative membrane protein
MASLFAFLHHIAAFVLAAALVIEFVLIRGDLSVDSARKLVLADLALGLSATVILVVGFLRVFYFEKGASYYFHSASFIAKLSLFVLVALLSIYPTVEFLSWRKLVKQQQRPSVSPAKLRAIRTIIHWELVGVVLIVLFATLMARGVGYLG